MSDRAFVPPDDDPESPVRPIWDYALTTCPICGHREVSVFPYTCTELECGGCGMMNPSPPPEERNQ